MNDQQGPREFWIGTRSHQVHDGPTWTEGDEIVHVIEHSAYEQLAKELERLRAENKSILENYDRNEIEKWREMCEKLAKGLERISNRTNDVWGEEVSRETIAAFDAFKRERGG